MNKNVFKNLSYGMYIVGAKDEKERNVGCVANSVCQISSSPCTITISLNHDNYTCKAIAKTNIFSISILKEETDPKIIGTFGYQSSLETEKFKEFEHDFIDNLPVLKNNCGILICRVIETMETSTHTVFLAEVIKTSNYTLDTPMTYRYYHEVLKGKSPKNAPTYIEEKTTEKQKWRCKVCGYEVEADTLDEDYVCPICGQPVSAFNKIK